METSLKTLLRRAKPGSDLRNLFLDVIVKDLMPILNRLPNAFFNLDAPERRRMLDLQVHDPELKHIAQEWFATGTYAGLGSGLYRFGREFGFCPLIAVQSAAPIPEKQRDEYQQVLMRQYPNGFILFQTLHDIGGGVRIFANGTLVENTWHGRLRTLISRLNQHTYV